MILSDTTLSYIETIKGFMDPEEGRALHDMALSVISDFPNALSVEIGSYCGKSTVYIGEAVRKQSGFLVSIDHHYGSEENQPGEEYFDPDLADAETGGMSSLHIFRQTIRGANLEDFVIPVVAPSRMASQVVAGEIGFLFIDGGHSMPAALDDYRLWATRVVTGGILAIHDVFPNPEDGGRPPYEIYKLAMASGLFEEVKDVKSLRFLRRL